MLYLTVAEVLERLTISRSTWQHWLVTGRGPQVRRLPNGQLRCREDWLEAWLDDLPAA